MKVVTAYPVYINNKKVDKKSEYLSADGDADDFYDATGKKIKAPKEHKLLNKIKGAHIGQKIGKFVKKVAAAIKKDARKLTHRKDKSGKSVYTDKLPTVTNGEKKLPDGSTVQVPASNIATINTPAGPVSFDKADVPNGGQPTATVQGGTPVLTKDYTEDQVTTVQNDDGSTETYKNSDIGNSGDANATGSNSGWSSLSNTKKGLIIGGIVLVVAGISFAIYKSRKKK